MHLQTGLRNGCPVVACALNYGGSSPVHFIQIDRRMSSLSEAHDFVNAANQFTGQQIRNEIIASHGPIVDAISKVFGASTQEAAARYRQLLANELLDRNDRYTGKNK
ncbi:hypothetical protein [Pantoea sp. CCBC3-3-1]|uniref:hypothetical protein n=1 Tax=Pantoea sp. CCBC3-3-1 TaxID=2490851 RepID=UPI0011BEF4B4|nr:hypothetical protein [Pantoea sp. CCBC3-3-1]